MIARLTNRSVAIAACCIGLTLAAAAQSPGPTPLPLPPPIEQPRDVPYPAALQLRVDATDVQRHLFTVHERIPVAGGAPLLLLYPQWIPGNHSPTGRVDFVAGLIIRSDNAPVAFETLLDAAALAVAAKGSYADGKGTLRRMDVNWQLK